MNRKRIILSLVFAASVVLGLSAMMAYLFVGKFIPNEWWLVYVYDVVWIIGCVMIWWKQFKRKESFVKAFNSVALSMLIVGLMAIFAEAQFMKLFIDLKL
jgi:hypothetical protein